MNGEPGFRYLKPGPMILSSSAEAKKDLKKTFDD
jgi:hypothetical protein